MKIKMIGDWTCKKCGIHLTLQKNDIHCGSCGQEAKLEDLFGQDDENIYFNSNY